MNKVAIIGANSFLAVRLRKQLVLHENIAVDLYGKNIEALSANETCYAFYLPADTIKYERLLSCDIIVYCAGAGIQSSVNTDVTYLNEVNIFEPIRMLEYLQQEDYQGKCITFGSYFEIGNNNVAKMYSEEDVLLSTLPLANEYARSKKELSEYLNRATFAFKTYHLILGSIYGKGENENRIIPYLIKQIQNNQPIKISSGEQIRQYIHVDDVVSLILQLHIDAPDSGIYNVSSIDSISIKELCAYVYSKLNASVEIQFGTLSKLDQQMGVLMLSVEKIMKHTSWKPSISLEQGVNEYIK